VAWDYARIAAADIHSHLEILKACLPGKGKAARSRFANF
jgi:hypothetical protein